MLSTRFIPIKSLYYGIYDISYYAVFSTIHKQNYRASLLSALTADMRIRELLPFNKQRRK